MSDRCSACPTESDGRYCSRPILPTSTGRATYLFLGAGPGKADAKTLTPYSGLGGIELNETYLPIAGLWRESEHLVLANASMCWDHTDRTPHENRVLSCARAHLPQLLSTVQPTVLVLMGGVTQKIADYPIRLNLHHGIPLWTTVLNGAWEGWVWPSYEPALGIRETGKMTPLMEDFRNLGKWMKGEWLPTYLTADEPERDYGLLASVREFDAYLEQYTDVRASGGVLRAGVDTERHGAPMWSIQFSVRKHTGRMFRTDGSYDSGKLIKRFRQWADQACDEILLHNREQDENALHSIGADVPEDRVRDTMKECYHLCKVPQGLKEAVYRLVGYSMPGWEDTVRAASTDAILEWIARAKALAQTQPEAVIHELKRGRCADCGHQHSKGPCKREGCGCASIRVTYSRVEWKPSALESVLTHVERYTLNTRDAEDPYDPWVQIGQKGKMRKTGLRGKVAGEEKWEWVERELGPTPILGIGNCELEKAVVYGCGDADMTLQLGEVLAEMRQGEEWKVSEEDWDQ
jgi:uracil-DNA glycosylase family 4